MRIDRGPASKPNKQKMPNVEEAELIAVEVLSFLSLETGRLVRFIETCGISPESLRKAAEQPGFLLAILEYVAEDESLLTTFAVNAGYDPAVIIQAKNRLSPQIDPF